MTETTVPQSHVTAWRQRPKILRKAKYLVRYQPSDYPVTAIGVRHDSLVSSQDSSRFVLLHDMAAFA